MNADGGQWPSVRGIWPNWMAAYGAAAACMLALPVAAASAAQAETIVPIVPIVPSTTPLPELSLGEQLKRTIRNMMVLIELTITKEKRRPEKHRICFDAVRKKIRLVDLYANRNHLAPSLVEGRRIGR
jgi:hypothetical protein